MIDGHFVFNAVAHAYDMRDENIQPNSYAEITRGLMIGLHRQWQSGGISAAGQSTDWPVEVLARTLFLESDCDMAATHTLRLDSLFKDGGVRHEKTLEAVRRWPQRFVGYVGLDPTTGLENCLRQLDEQLDDLPEAVGLKLYPAQVNPHRGWRMDDRKLLYPLYERALERGLKVVAVHKAMPYGPVPANPFKVEDIDAAADAFPTLNFEIIHAGVAFAEETASQIARFPNVFANFEATSAMINWLPIQFETVMALFMKWGGPSKIIYSDGSMVFHSQPILEKLAGFRFTQKALDDYALEQITEGDIAQILGGNFARLIGVDVEAARARLAEDEFSRERARTGRQEAYSNWREFLRAEHGILA